MNWEIFYYNKQVKESILNWPKKIQSKYLFITTLIEEHGPNIGMPFVKVLGNGLFEIRASGQEGWGRAFFCTLVGKKVMILHDFIKKTNKTPKDVLDIATKRLKELKK